MRLTPSVCASSRTGGSAWPGSRRRACASWRTLSKISAALAPVMLIWPGSLYTLS
ncbi:Uncharacterised protein [Bordetella pertussis]|nr:Uncharacterised protein [Bordetella pertussis]